MANRPTPAARLAWINTERAHRGLAPLAAAAFAAIQADPGYYDDADSPMTAEAAARDA